MRQDLSTEGRRSGEGSTAAGQGREAQLPREEVAREGMLRGKQGQDGGWESPETTRKNSAHEHFLRSVNLLSTLFA